MLFYNSTYLIFMLPGFLLALAAQLWVNRTYGKWSEVRNRSALSGMEAAKRLMDYGGLGRLNLEEVGGRLSDHYDPRSKTLRLSSDTARGNSVASLAITAHEVGHALQDAKGYAPLRYRNALVPAVNIGSRLGFLFIVVGLIMQNAIGQQLAWIGVGTFGLGALFSLATLPIELNASSRAKALLQTTGIIQTKEEREGVNSVLNAAALTYVAALATAILQMLYWVTLVGGMSGRRR